MSERTNQRLRTRKDLLDAASRIMAQGKTPTLEEVAADAKVSRATAYRYFPSMDALLLEAGIEVGAPDVARILANAPADDPVERALAVDSAFNDMVLANEGPIRVFLAHSLQQNVLESGGSSAPVRQNRRSPAIDAALAPLQSKLAAKDLLMLKRALALLIGGESVFICKDVLGLNEKDMRAVKAWAVRALVTHALK